MAQLSPIVVKEAIDTLRDQGKKVTNRNIIDCLGYGSFSTLKKIRESYPEFFSDTYNDTIVVSDTYEINSALEKRVSLLETSIQLMQQSIQQLIQLKVTSSNLEKQVKELTEDLQEMYQLWRELVEKVVVQSSEKVIPVEQSTEVTNSKPAAATFEKPSCDWITQQIEIPDPKQGEIFLAWAEQQKKLNNGWQPVVDQLNQQQIFMPKGGAWTAKSLSDFIRKKRQQFKGKRNQLR